MNPANVEATPRSIAAYLVAAYEVDEATAAQLVASEEHAEAVRKATTFRSHAYYPGESIASAAGLTAREGYDLDEEEDDDDDDW